MIWRQHWTDVLFLHFPVPCEKLRPLVPPPLALDTLSGQCWLSFVLFRLLVRGIGLPAIPGLSSLLELNVRTYVRYRDQPGIYFLRMYADNWLAIVASKLLTPLCYERAAIIDERFSGGQRHIECRACRGGAGVLRGQTLSSGPPHQALPGSLEWWLLERYRLFVVESSGRLIAADVEHPPWRSAAAEFTATRNDLCCELGLSLTSPQAAHESRGVAARFNAFRCVEPARAAVSMNGAPSRPPSGCLHPARAGGRCAGQ
jgi:uncharacterized protein YqjF (DUF2071 family)